MRLIDADALIERLDDFNKWCKDERLQGSLFAVDVVGDMPTVDVMDKVRAEIEACREDEEPHLCDHRHYRNEGIDKALEVIDKYR